jgi:hypothetical protein
VPAGLAASPLPSTSLGAAPEPPLLTEATAIEIFLDDPKVAAWLERYPPSPQTDATYELPLWTVNVWSGKAGQIATGKIDDPSGIVIERWVGPQVAWTMARGTPGAFGGEQINSYPIWLGFCALFLVGLFDWRRPLSLRNLDLLVLLSFSVSLWFFNRGHVFASTSLAYPALLWLLARCTWIGCRDRSVTGKTFWPVWLIAGTAIFVGGFRVSMNIRSSNVIDVGYAGVIGADRIAHGQTPYGHFPVEQGRPKCGPPDVFGKVVDHLQENGRCETPSPSGDTYGPVAYEAYLPAYGVFGWSGKWDSLPAVHATTILWDLLCLLGLVFVGRRFGGNELAATLAFAWVTWPFTQYASSSNTNDAIQPALLIWAFYFATSQFRRGVLTGLSAWSKFGPLLLLPLWAGYPEARRPRPAALFSGGFLVATAAAFSFLAFEASPLHELRVFFDRTIWTQIERHSPFSLWDWGQYHARGLPDLAWLQHVLQGCLVVCALALGWWPRRRSALQLAAFTGALLIGFEIVLTHWSYFYLPWVFPFVAFALFASPSAALFHGHADRLAASGAPVAVAVDEHALDPHVAAGGLEPDGHPGDETPDRPFGDAPDH